MTEINDNMNDSTTDKTLMTNKDLEFLCDLCDQVYDIDELVIWHHPDIDNGRYQYVCPHCLAKAERLGKADDRDTVIRLMKALTYVDDDEDNRKDE